ncbi:hypothetical protein CF326_g9376 [Tilletia indica]|nr:hypothetical protein CF326_g9376 [Tilletia indica]
MTGVPGAVVHVNSSKACNAVTGKNCTPPPPLPTATLQRQGQGRTETSSALEASSFSTIHAGLSSSDDCVRADSAARVMSELRWHVRNQNIDDSDYGALNNAFMEVRLRTIMNECDSKGLNITLMGQTACHHFRHGFYPSFFCHKTDITWTQTELGPHHVRDAYHPAAAMRFDVAFRQSYSAHIINIVADSFGLELSGISTDLLRPL